MSEKEQKIIESISDALPKMSDFDKGYFLGAAEQMVSEKEKKETQKNDSGRTKRGGGVDGKAKRNRFSKSSPSDCY